MSNRTRGAGPKAAAGGGTRGWLRALSSCIRRSRTIRQVREHPDRPRTGYIDVLHEPIPLPVSYVSYFVLAEWNVTTERLAIWFEKDSTPKRIKSVKFTLNPNSRYKLR